MRAMTTLVLTVIGNDRAGLVNALAETVADGEGNWEQSHLAELAGTFAGLVVVTVPDARADAMMAALRPLSGLLEITVHRGEDDSHAPAAGTALTIELIGNDHPGMVRDVSAVLAGHDVTIVELSSDTRQAPMAGGTLFEATVCARTAASTDLAALRDDLERLAGELLVDLTLSED